MDSVTEIIERFIAEHPDRKDGSWSGWGGSLVWRIKQALGEDPKPYSTAFDAYFETVAIRSDATEAPAGAVHWWIRQGDPTRSNAGIDIDGGGKRVLLASGVTAGGEEVGKGLIVTTVAGYTEWFEDHVYGGWSRSYGATRQPEFTPEQARAIRFSSAAALRDHLGEPRGRTLPELMLVVLDAATADSETLRASGMVPARDVLADATGSDLYPALREVLEAIFAETPSVS